jgi:hypothetical protein
MRISRGNRGKLMDVTGVASCRLPQLREGVSRAEEFLSKMRLLVLRDSSRINVILSRPPEIQATRFALRYEPWRRWCMTESANPALDLSGLGINFGLGECLPIPYSLYQLAPLSVVRNLSGR